MQITVEGQAPQQQSYFFEPSPNKLMEDKDYKQILTKWGLAQTLRIASFRFNQAFQEFELDRFLLDLFNNPNLRFLMPNVHSAKQAVSSIEVEKQRCSELTLQLFGQLEQEDIVRKGYISKMMSQYYEEIEVCDKLRECLLLEQSQTYCTFNEHQRKQLLLKLFQMLVVGGSFNQYEDMIAPYLDWTKKLYKSLVSVRKRSETEEIFVESQFYQVKSMDKGKSYKKGYHPQSLLFVIVNPSIRTVHVVANQWKKFW